MSVANQAKLVQWTTRFALAGPPQNPGAACCCPDGGKRDEVENGAYELPTVAPRTTGSDASQRTKQGIMKRGRKKQQKSMARYEKHAPSQRVLPTKSNFKSGLQELEPTLALQSAVDSSVSYIWAV